MGNDRVGAICLALTVTACVTPTYPAHLHCGPTGGCPPDQFCEMATQICQSGSPTGPGSPDAQHNMGPPDASHMMGPPDAASTAMGCPSFTPVEYMIGAPTGIAVGDLNDDGKPDLVGIFGTRVTILFQQGGTLGGQLDLPVTGGNHVAIGDVNGDGRNDLVIGNGNQVGVVLQDPAANGQFGPENSFGANAGSVLGLAVGKLDADKLADVVTADMNGGISILRSDLTQPGRLLAPVNAGAPGTFISGIVIADLNGDGANDIAFSDGASLSGLFQDAAIPGHFLSPRNLGPSGSPSGSWMFAADVNRDGTLDVLSPGHIALQIPGSAGMFMPGTPLPTQQFGAMADFNGDGVQDLVLFNPGLMMMTVLMGTGAATGPSFAACTSIPSAMSIDDVATGDLNGDGRPDVVISIGVPSSLLVMTQK